MLDKITVEGRGRRVGGGGYRIDKSEMSLREWSTKFVRHHAREWIMLNRRLEKFFFEGGKKKNPNITRRTH